MTEDIRLSRDSGLLRVGAAQPPIRLADVDFNVDALIAGMEEAAGRGVQVLAFPEMSLTGYTLGDIVQQQALLAKAGEGLERLLKASAAREMVVIAGLPLVFEQQVFNCGAVINKGRLLGVVPKGALPSYKEYYDGRWFTSGRAARSDRIELAGQDAPFGMDVLLSLKGIDGAVIGVEVCEDLWIPLAPHEFQALAGATVLFNLSASNEVLGKADWRRTMVASESGRCIAAFCYVSCGLGESSNDVVFSGHTIMAENGVVLEESDPMCAEPRLIVADFDLERLQHDRLMMTSFRDARLPPGRTIEAEVSDPFVRGLERPLNPHPFVPHDPAQRAGRCRDIFSMQVAALAQKLTGSRLDHLVLGVSGGLDSALALLAAVKTMDYLKKPAANVHAYTLPGFGTTARTLNNATKLCRALGVSFERVNITRSCRSHLRDMRHEGEEDIAFENVQARYRTEFLFNQANRLGAIVLGTGDLTEVALGWSTFSGDHMSHYHVNVSVPKTLVQYLVRWVADEEFAGRPPQKLLYDILETPISPELQRPREGGVIGQLSEEIIGPVELADYFLYPFIRFGMRPGRILYLADETRRRGLFNEDYTLEDLHRWLKSFLVRFFANQFKRTCLPEGPKVGSVSLSPRGDWRMPSDATARLWLEDLERMYARLRMRGDEKSKTQIKDKK
jgi:NAD+ synthase (glutamine-hydrolysing)